MWLFDTPKSYTEMIKKIAWSMFFIVLFGLIFITHISEGFSNTMRSLSFGIEVEYNSIKVYIAYVWIPLLFAIFENIFKLHDKISDLFKIRYRYDKYIILKRMLEKLDLLSQLSYINTKNRDRIMSDVFYKYAGYAHPEIDEHLIAMALGSWCWYWILLDTLLVTVLISTIVLILEFSIVKLLIVIGVIAFLVAVFSLIKSKECKKYAFMEVDAILDNPNRRDEIGGYLKCIIE